MLNFDKWFCYSIVMQSSVDEQSIGQAGQTSAFMRCLDLRTIMATGGDRRVFGAFANTAWQAFNFGVIVGMHEIANGYAAFSPETHDTAISALSSVGRTMNVAEAQALFDRS